MFLTLKPESLAIHFTALYQETKCSQGCSTNSVVTKCLKKGKTRMGRPRYTFHRYVLFVKQEIITFDLCSEKNKTDKQIIVMF